MRAAQTVEANGQVAVVELEDPEPDAGLVVVRMRTVLLDRFDRDVYQGRDPATFPLIQGSAGAGQLETGGGSLTVGSRVVVWPRVECRRCSACRAEQFHRCVGVKMLGRDVNGLLAERVAVPRTAVVKLPDGIGPAMATLAVRYAAAWRLLHTPGDAVDGSRVLVAGRGVHARRVARLADQMGARVDAYDDLTDARLRYDIAIVAGPVEGVRAELVVPDGAMVVDQSADGATGAIEPSVIAQRRIRIMGTQTPTQRDLVHFLKWLAAVDWREEEANVVGVGHVADRLAADTAEPTIVTV